MELPYGKIAIYALTFIAYAYSGYGSGVLGNLRDAVITAQSVFGDLLQNVVTVANRFKSLHDVFDAAVEEHCVFKCPSGEYFNSNNTTFLNTVFKLQCLILNCARICDVCAVRPIVNHVSIA